MLHKELEAGSFLACYADDTLILTEADNAEEALMMASIQVHRILKVIKRIGLRVATSKTEVTIFSRHSLSVNINTDYLTHNINSFVVEKDTVEITKHFKYLGVYLDSRLTFEKHFEYAIKKTAGVTGALTGLMPNLRGPCEAKRKLFANVVLSVLLYGAPIWSTYLFKRKKMITQMNQSIRMICNRVVGGYRTIAQEATLLLARVPPVALQADCRRRIYERVKDLYNNEEYSEKGAAEIKHEETLLMYRQWYIKLTHAEYGLRTINAILPCYQRWLDRKHGALEFHLTQILTGHGVFGNYLYRIQKADTPLCLSCNEDVVDTVEHTITECSRWVEQRRTLTATIGPDLNLSTIFQKMLDSKNNWLAITAFAKQVMLIKEDEERARQARRSRSRSLSIRSSTDNT